jgi:predicted transport protein
MIIIQDDSKFQESSYTLEDSLEKDVVVKSKHLFGENTIYIDAKRKIDTKSLGGTIPDAFLFDLSDKDNPEFYIVEVELSSHDYYKHIFPQITKFFAFFKNPKSQSELVEKIFSIINNESNLKKEFKKYLGETEIYKFIKDLVDSSQNILLIMDGEKDELPEIMETYSDTWGKMVKVLTLRKFTCGDSSIYTLDPDFENIEYAYVEPVAKAEQTEGMEYSEEFHLDGVDKEVRETWYLVRKELQNAYPTIIFNPTKYYISIKLGKVRSYFQFRKKKIRLVAMLPEDEVRRKIQKHTVVHLTDSVQGFWNGQCCEIIIENSKDLDEIIDVLKAILNRS